MCFKAGNALSSSFGSPVPLEAALEFSANGGAAVLDLAANGGGVALDFAASGGSAAFELGGAAVGGIDIYKEKIPRIIMIFQKY